MFLVAADVVLEIMIRILVNLQVNGSRSGSAGCAGWRYHILGKAIKIVNVLTSYSPLAGRGYRFALVILSEELSVGR